MVHEKPHETARLVCPECADALRSRKLTPEEVAKIQTGAWVKVCHNDEGFWIKVYEVEGNTVRGTVDNDLVKEHPFKCGDALEVELDEIYQVMGKE